jgi:hypothetical protein
MILCKNLLTIREHLFSPPCFVSSVLLIFLVFCVVLCFACLRLVSCVTNVATVWILHFFGLSFRFSITFIFYPYRCSRMVSKFLHRIIMYIFIKIMYRTSSGPCKFQVQHFSLIKKKHERDHGICKLIGYILLHCCACSRPGTGSPTPTFASQKNHTKPA